MCRSPQRYSQLHSYHTKILMYLVTWILGLNHLLGKALAQAVQRGGYCLETFKARLDGALSNLIQLKMSLLTAGGLDKMAFKGCFQPKPFCGPTIL